MTETCPERDCTLELPKTELKAHLMWDHHRDEDTAENMVYE